jgi:hypothetical protein
MAATKSRIEKNLQQVRETIKAACARAGRDASEVSVVAVTKSEDMESIRALLDLGVTDLGESRALNLAERAAEVAKHLQHRKNPLTVRWHMVGHLQRNKVRLVMDWAQVIHSIDSLRLAEEINIRAERDGRVVNVLLQVNCSVEPQKFGVAVGAARHLGELICTLKNLRLAGLMTMGPLVEDPEQARPSFSRLRETFDEMRNEKIGGEHFRHLSMGMSGDYAVAVEEGATILRIGTALFE